MKVLYANILNETQKLFLKKKTIALLVVTAILPIASAVILSIFQKNIGIIPVNANQFSIFILGLFINYVLPLFITMAAVDIFTGEFNDRTLKAVLLRPISRFKVFSSKIICIGIYIVVYLITLLLFSTISGSFLQGDGSFLNGFLLGMVAYIVSVIPMIGIGIAAAFISQLFKSSSGALVIAIIIYITLSVTSRFFPVLSRSLLTSYSDWYLLWIGSTVLVGKIFNAAIVILSYCLILFAGGFYLFDKKEI